MRPCRHIHSPIKEGAPCLHISLATQISFPGSVASRAEPRTTSQKSIAFYSRCPPQRALVADLRRAASADSLSPQRQNGERDRRRAGFPLNPALPSWAGEPEEPMRVDKSVGVWTHRATQQGVRSNNI